METVKTPRSTIIMVDDNQVNLSTGRQILKNDYNVFPAPSAARLFELLKEIKTDLILLDIEMPGFNGFETIAKLKEDPETADIPVIFLTAKRDHETELEGLKLGAVDYVGKPFSPPLLLKRIDNQLTIVRQRNKLHEYNENLQYMVDIRTKQVIELQNAILSTVAELVEVRDNITGGHIGRTQRYLQLLIDKLLKEKIYTEETGSWNMSFLIPSAQLHDVGKIAISDAILNKPGRLTADEFEIMKKHAGYGEEAISMIMENTSEKNFLSHAKVFAGAHHEKWDGSGYPRGLKGEDIPLEGRLMAVVDVYDALTGVRPYKEPMSASDAEMIIVKGKETHFDPLMVELFEDLAPNFADIAVSGGAVPIAA